MLKRVDKPKVGLLICALLEDEWNKTGYLRPAAQASVKTFTDALSSFAEVVCPGLVETEEQAAQADLAFKQAGVEAVIFTEIAYIQSLIPMRCLKQTQVPIIVWNTQAARFWPETADWDFVMLNSGLAGLPETTHALTRSGRKFHIVTGHVDDKAALARLRRYCVAAAIAQRLRWTTIGMVGHPYQYMADLMVDTYALRDKIGPTVKPIELEDIAVATAAVTDDEAQALMAEAKAAWRTDELDEFIFKQSARCAAGLEKVVLGRNLDAVAHFDQALMADPRCGLCPSWGTSRLMGMGIPVTAEGDVNTCTAMLILNALAERSSFVENYGFDFDQGAAYVAHDSMGDPFLAAPEPKVALRHSVYYRGIYGMGAALEYAYKPGPVTMLALVQLDQGRWRLVAGEGESLPLKPRPTVAPQMLFRAAQSTIEAFYDAWCLAGSGHHCAFGYGHLGEDLRVLAEMLGIEFELVR